ncbi:MAG: 16S rRNA (guanine(527)-N(7))-methyltransferase RsmG [Burkholderiales bacterium PBB5]|nr:MAG: 16S rRNA (guanine(527)-N(7))-methyltransferase RsmG [Burkholderiales bacterium PBB5]
MTAAPPNDATDAGSNPQGDQAASAATALTPVPPSARHLALVSAAQVLGLDLPAPTAERLLAYLDMLQQWNKVYNLTALRDPSEMFSHHLVDCLTVLPALARHAQGRPLRVLDVGSGGGLPGVVLAITHPEWQVSCVDTVSKKASFIRQVAAELALPNLRALHARVETLDPAAMRFDVITSRAFASLGDFTALTAPLLAPQAVWMAMKGRLPDDERAALPADVDVFHVEQLQVPGLDAQRCLVWMRPAAAA